MGTLDGLGYRLYRREVVVGPVVLGLVLRPELLHGLDGLPGLGPPMVEVAAHDLRFLSEPAGADPEDEAAVGVPVQGGDLLGQQQRVALGHQADAGAQLDRCRYRRRPGQGHERVDDAPVLFRDDAVRRAGVRRCCPDRKNRVFRHPERLETQLLGPLRQERRIGGAVYFKGENPYLAAGLAHGTSRRRTMVVGAPRLEPGECSNGRFPPSNGRTPAPVPAEAGEVRASHCRHLGREGMEFWSGNK